MRSSFLFRSCCASALIAVGAPIPAQTGARTPAASAAATPAAGPAWAQDKSDLTPDPAIRYGRLANGMRYAIRHNTTPPGEAQVYLRIGAGSLVERDDQQGLAHFMEHMVFNGTKNVPEGEFVRKLERLGLAFGADTNASTDFRETVYTLNLPSIRDEVMDTSLMLMRETADRALLETAAINRERGVILAEERSRDGPQLRMSRAQSEFFLKGQLLPKRYPIGTFEVINNAPREQFLEFYEAYYRPENATLIVVGDVNVDAIERKIRTQFGDWRGEGPAGPPANPGTVAKRGLDVSVYSEPGVPSSITVAWVGEPERDPDTRAKRKQYFREQLGVAVLNRRLSRVALRADAPFSFAAASHSSSEEAVSSTGIAAQFSGGNWRPALAAMEQEQRRLVQYGVTRAELDREIAGTVEGLKGGIAGETTRSSSELAGNILTGVSEDKVVTRPEDRLALYEEAVRGLTPEQVSAEMRRLFQGSGPLIYVTSPTPLPGVEVAVQQAYQSSRQVVVAPPPQNGGKAWAYTDFGTPGRVVERREIADLGTTFLRFANGVRLTVRPSQFEKDSIGVSVRVGDGQRDLPLDRPSPGWAARAALIEGGLGRMTLEQIDDALAGKSYGANVIVGEDAFYLGGTTRPQDFLTEMQVLAAFSSDPGWRGEGLARVKEAALAQDEQLRTTPSGALASTLSTSFHSGDPRFGMPTPAQIKATTVADVRKALAGITEEPIEVLVTGDTTVDEAIRTTARTFGALPPRRPASFPPAAARVRFPTPPPAPIRVQYDGRPDQAMAVIAWPTRDIPSDQQEARAVRALAAVLRLRLTDEIREKQAITYSPGVEGDASWTYPNYGFLAAVILATPNHLEPFVTDTFKITKSLRDTPVTADELNRAIGPMISALHREQESNGYWAGALAGAQTDPRRLTAIRDATEGLKRVTPADVEVVAREYLQDHRALRAFAVPEARVASGSAKPTGDR